LGGFALEDVDPVVRGSEAVTFSIFSRCVCHVR
jgi:hypothetical protein